jgi:signal transduction histidine kinase
MRKDQQVSQSLFSLGSYLIFFLSISFLVTSCFLLFLRPLQLDEDSLRNSALLTFVNVIFLSLLCAIGDGIRRKVTVERPIKRILEVTNRITDGDFSARIERFHGLDRINHFDIIIENFNKMAEELSSTETLRTDFIANVSHELKTPLSVIQNYATMLQDPTLPEEKRLEYAKTVSTSSQRLSDLITNILRLNKLENQQIFPEAKEYNLGEQLCSSLLTFENIWEEKGLTIDTDIAEDVKIKADEELMMLVWNNLFSNAVKFTEPGDNISVSLKDEKGYAVVKISDTGCGMSPEVGKHIFEKFYQGDGSRSTQGNGLGLSLVKRVIEIVEGEILVKSTPGEGSTFIVKLEKQYV